jgi:2-polyprenyl-6-hydroxyphenyl methylase/3-demethylubiquinone-9 3-methyltransferase
VRATAGEAARFGFGGNWGRFLATVSEERIAAAEGSLRRMLSGVDWRGVRFLDVRSGSGLFSLAARRLGARVLSFDLDPLSVACTAELRRLHFPDDRDWVVQAGSVLESDYLSGLGMFDLVYAWGSLHHTGALWRALENVAARVDHSGRLFVAIYNDQGIYSRAWRAIKRSYNSLPGGLRFLVVLPVFARLWGPTLLLDLLCLRPFRTWRTYARDRGMAPWRNVVDWVGGYPFEVAKPEEVFAFLRERGFALEALRTCGGGHGCNEFVFARAGSVSAAAGRAGAGGR